MYARTHVPTHADTHRHARTHTFIHMVHFIKESGYVT